MARDTSYSPGSAASDDVDMDDGADYRPEPTRKEKGKGRARNDVSAAAATGGGERGGGRPGADDGRQAWEGMYKRSWDVVQEDAEGGLQAAVDSLIARGRRKRALMSDTPLRRSIIRHMFIILDLSDSMRDKDFRPDRFEVTLTYLRTYVVEWFDQNPLGQVGIILMRDRLAEVLIPMGGNPQEILAVLSDKRKLEPSGEPSLQNGLVMAKGGMAHLPSSSSLETLVLFSSISTSDPDGPTSIHQVLLDLVAARVRTTIISLSGEIKICRQICERTGGRFGVAIDEEHYRELLWETIPPPAQSTTLGVRNALAAGGAGAAGGLTKRPPPAGDLMVMGFPVRLPQGGESLCACHGLLKRGGYLCPRCGSKMCDVPTDCEVCGLMVVSSPHLARSFWFLFPVANYGTLPLEQAMEAETHLQASCFGCDTDFPTMEDVGVNIGVAAQAEGVSPTGRYRCAKCQNDFCGDCDLYIHDTLHTCPGCSQ